MAENGLENTSQDERGLRGPPQACIFVASIATTSTEEKLQEHFSKFGQVLKVKLMKDKAMRPYAFVQFMVRTAVRSPLSVTFAAKSGRRGSNSSRREDGEHGSAVEGTKT